MKKVTAYLLELPELKGSEVMQLPEMSPEYLLEGPRGTRLSQRTAAAQRRSCGRVKYFFLTVIFESFGKCFCLSNFLQK